MDCRMWKLAAVGLALLCGACGRPAGTGPSPTAVPADPAALPAATGRAVATPVPIDAKDQGCPPTEPSSSPDCDREVLLAARDVLRGANTDALRTWQRDHPLGSFEGVRVDPSSGRVVTIKDTWLTPLLGSIPPELGQLDHLQVLDLRHNQLTGSIPSELGQLGQLRILNLSFNRLTGVIPPELGQLGHLQRLELDRNRLTGPIPSELGQLGQLGWLRLDHNRLTCTIPPELEQLDRLRELDLSHNLLNNLMTGRVPVLLPHHLYAGELDATGNRLTFTMPRIPERGTPPVAGIYTDQAAHWGGQYRVRREGRQVTATLAVHRAPVGQSAPPAARGLPAAVADDLDDGGPAGDGTGPALAGGPGGDRDPGGAPGRDGAPPGRADARRGGVCGVPHRHHLDDGGEGSAPHGGDVHDDDGRGNLPPGPGGTVTATLAFRPADGLGAGPPAHLFTVPAGFRPARTVRRSVVVDKAGCHSRTLEVRPQGTVRLLAVPVSAVTEPPVHETTMTWTTGADVCQRHIWVQARLLQALRSQGRVRDSCAEVTWPDLASVRSLNLKPAATLRAWLEGTPPLQAHDLAGLTGLRTLALQGDVWFPAVPVDLLVHAPALGSLDLSGSRLPLPPSFLAHAPELRRLTLRDVDPNILSFLPPGLEVLDLEVPVGRTELPPDLFHAPKLRALTLRAAGLTRLPGDWLAHVPQLEYLTLDIPRLTVLPVDFQTDTPNLREIRDPGGCAVSATDPADRPHLLARFLEACGNP